MRGQTIELSGERDAMRYLATIEDDVSIDVLDWGGLRMPLALAPDHAAQPHLIEGDRVVRVIVGDPDDVEAHTLSLRFPSAEEAARFRMKVLAGTLIVGTLAVPMALAVSQASSDAAGSSRTAPIVAPVQQAAPLEVAAPAGQPATPVDDEPEAPGFTLQSKGTTVATGEDNRTGSSVIWIHSSNDDMR
ncbi:MAG TPA: hypothetical protein VIF84_05835 [Candidatus Limnocylindrales bacterium]|jgi:hypothetical protein